MIKWENWAVSELFKAETARTGQPSWNSGGNNWNHIEYHWHERPGTYLKIRAETVFENFLIRYFEYRSVPGGGQEILPMSGIWVNAVIPSGTPEKTLEFFDDLIRFLTSSLIIRMTFSVVENQGFLKSKSLLT